MPFAPTGTSRARTLPPVCTYAMTAYTQALNYLLRGDNVRRIGDVTVVYWVENADPAIAAFAGAMLFGPQEQSD